MARIAIECQMMNPPRPIGLTVIFPAVEMFNVGKECGVPISLAELEGLWARYQELKSTYEAAHDPGSLVPDGSGE